MVKTIYKECTDCNKITPHKVGRRKVGKQSKAPTKNINYCLFCNKGKVKSVKQSRDRMVKV